VPAAALTLSAFVSRLKFLSIGTNDLIQYTLAIDRNDTAVAHLYDNLHPAVLQLIHKTIHTGEKARIPVSVCGEMAGDVPLVELLLGMGLRQFSMHPTQLLAVKQRLFELSTRNATRLAARVLRSRDPVEIRRAIERGRANGAQPVRREAPRASAPSELTA
ncbi:MAG TPA: putative PEP-binding protein, partial [Steroidobacteraceae bacterium]|nr:putative PEP-binding protein [Steroidobacteraceae bacterium]